MPIQTSKSVMQCAAHVFFVYSRDFPSCKGWFYSESLCLSALILCNSRLVVDLDETNVMRVFKLLVGIGSSKLLLARLMGQHCFALWRLSSYVWVCNTPRAGKAITSCRLQSNYSSTVTLHGGPVLLRPVRPVRATPCSSLYG